MEDEKESLTAEEKAAIEARIAEVDRQLAELDERPDKPKEKAVLDNGTFRQHKSFNPIRSVSEWRRGSRVISWTAGLV